MNINLRPKKCSGQSRYSRYGSYATGPTANLVIVFETFKRSHNLKTWLRFVPRRGKIFLASYCMYSFSCCYVELRDTNTNCIIGSLAICFGIRLCRSVRSYVCAEILSTRKGSPSKGHLHSPYPPGSATDHSKYCTNLALITLVPVITKIFNTTSLWMLRFPIYISIKGNPEHRFIQYVSRVSELRAIF